ncbi:hypothetical protein K439DRAFT_1379083 [Ramaria rubella]|nr:hypothetical protein K439DRAFT_1379083 [Ramaria rubella]
MAQSPPQANGHGAENGGSLARILDRNYDGVEGTMDVEDNPDQEEPTDSPGASEGFCVECEDQPAEIACEDCKDVFCEVCFHATHRKGNRKRHSSKPLKGAPVSKTKVVKNGTLGNQEMEEQLSDGEEEPVHDSTKLLGAQPELYASVGSWFVERSRYIPLRLTYEERKFLRLVEAALSVSEYTDKVDTIGFGLSKAKRIVHQIRELCAILSGLVLAADYKRGQELFQDRNFENNAEFYQQVFELTRRHKIMNPEKMRTTYGKLVYVLMDAQIPEVKTLLDFSCVRPIKTVYSVLEEHGALDLLKDNLITVATREIYSEDRSRREIQKDIRAKERAIEALATRYARAGLPQENVRQCLYSIGDNNAFLRVNRDPCEKMIAYLKHYYHPTQAKDPKVSLAIRSGKGGARLSHDHAKQYSYVLQSLTLWREILHEMFHLWCLAEDDLLSPTISYRLRDTGQGLNRVQPAPKTSRMMHTILHKAQQSIGHWVGSSVIHMGDHNVPNALMFIEKDKYTQIYRILLPICNVLSQIPNLMNQPALATYIETEFGSTDNVYREILGDFFRHGFDGSGADNFFDAGSCIDGRLTSAWHWCSSIEKKRYWPIFLLTGFTSFDGEW